MDEQKYPRVRYRRQYAHSRISGRRLNFDSDSGGAVGIGPDLSGTEYSGQQANSTRGHAEVLLVADPQNPRNLIVCSMIEPKQPTSQMHSCDRQRVTSTERPFL